MLLKRIKLVKYDGTSYMNSKKMVECIQTSFEKELTKWKYISFLERNYSAKKFIQAMMNKSCTYVRQM